MRARILFLQTAVYLGLCAFSAAAFALEPPETPGERKTTSDWKANAVSRPAKTVPSPSATPVATATIGPREIPAPGKFTIALDIGHTQKKGGAISARGVFEYQFNRRLANELFQRLRTSSSVRPVLINPDGAEISLPKRAEEATRQKADLFLALHHDSVKDSYLKTWEVEGKTQKYCDDFHGYSIFISNKNAKAIESLGFASALGRALLKAGFTPTLHHATQENRPVLDKEKGIYSFDNLVVLKTAQMPAVLLECGVIVNRDEEEKLNDPAYRGRLIDAISSAIESLAVETSTAPNKN
jgi:N-acetylmuramoyl-L-alanine amidase